MLGDHGPVISEPEWLNSRNITTAKVNEYNNIEQVRGGKKGQKIKGHRVAVQKKCHKGDTGEHY